MANVGVYSSCEWKNFPMLRRWSYVSYVTFRIYLTIVFLTIYICMFQRKYFIFVTLNVSVYAIEKDKRNTNFIFLYFSSFFFFFNWFSCLISDYITWNLCYIIYIILLTSIYLYYIIVRRFYIHKIIMNFFCRKYEIRLTKIWIHLQVTWRYKGSFYQFRLNDIVDPECLRSLTKKETNCKSKKSSGIVKRNNKEKKGEEK